MFGRNLKTIRKKWRYDQEEFGELMGASRGQISQYETGNNDPRISFLLDLERMSGISCQRLYEVEINNNEVPEHPLKGEGQAVRMFALNEEKTPYFNPNAPTEQNKIIEAINELFRRVEKLEGKE